MRAGWETVRLADVCTFRPPKSEARKRLAETDIVSFAPMEDLGVNQKYLKPSGVRPLGSVAGSYTYFADGDVLLAKITPCFENGKLGIAHDLQNGVGFGSSEYFVIRPSSRVTAEYLYYFLSQPSFREAGAQSMTGAVGHKRVAKDFLEEHALPLPPPAEQQSIVAILDEAFAGIATARVAAEQNRQNARALLERHLQSVFSQRGEGWSEAPLSSMCDIKHGFAFKSEFFTSDGEYVLLTPGNFYESGGYRDRGEKQKYYCGEVPPGFVLGQGDLLVAMTEQAAGLLGSSILVPSSGKYLHNQRLGLVTGKAGVAWSNEFFFHVFNTPAVRKAIHDSASGVKVRHTSPGKIGQVLVAFPQSIDEQKAIVAQLESLQKETQSLEALYQRKLEALDELKRSLLHQAFSGEL
ncbi:MAG: restriction endonuclease subunit S [Pseudomonadota bacterium]